MRDPRLQKLIDTVHAVSSERDVSALLERILDTVIDLTGAERGFLLVHDGKWHVPVARNMDRKEIARAQEKVSRTILGRLREERQPLLLADADLPGAKSIRKQKVRAVCAVPVGEKAAVYLDHRKKPDVFRRADLDLVSAFAGLASVALGKAKELVHLREQIARRNPFENIVGSSKAMQILCGRLEKAAASPYPVFLYGESGTGKELAARAIHNHGPRREKPFVAANCGAVSDTLLASELFGHLRGAFTGADDERTGLFEAAHLGTLFLDEIGTMSGEMQESLLRAVQENEIRPLGSEHPKPVDVRIIAASNIDPAVLADRGELRSDLYYRLNVLRIDIPPLRDRREDIPELVDHFLALASEESGGTRRTATKKAIDRLMEHAWPGNVRELENTVRRAVAMSEKRTLDADDFTFLRPVGGGASEIVHIDEYIRQVLEKHGETLGLKEIADRLGVSRKTLWEKKKRWNLP
ncbi:MAG: sigma 54-interacting transcriptional regulator [Planctomycetota bacterium]|jgi:transcriptional regulator with PAS, ATPase and Fis domain